MDIDPAIIEAPYHNEVFIDGGVKTLAPLLTLYDGMVASLEEKREGEMTAQLGSIEKLQLVLYSRSSCSYCKKVISYLKKNHKEITVKDIGKDSKAANELITIGGRQQVPCLVINGKALYESSAIIKWLRDHKDQY